MSVGGHTMRLDARQFAQSLPLLTLRGFRDESIRDGALEVVISCCGPTAILTMMRPWQHVPLVSASGTQEALRMRMKILDAHVVLVELGHCYMELVVGPRDVSVDGAGTVLHATACSMRTISLQRFLEH